MCDFVFTQTTVSEKHVARACASVANPPATAAPAFGCGAAGADAGANCGAGAGAAAAGADAGAGAAAGIVSVPERHAATKARFVCPLALIAALFAAYSALH